MTTLGVLDHTQRSRLLVKHFIITPDALVGGIQCSSIASAQRCGSSVVPCGVSWPRSRRSQKRKVCQTKIGSSRTPNAGDQVEKGAKGKHLEGMPDRALLLVRLDVTIVQLLSQNMAALFDSHRAP